MTREVPWIVGAQAKRSWNLEDLKRDHAWLMSFFQWLTDQKVVGGCNRHQSVFTRSSPIRNSSLGPLELRGQTKEAASNLRWEQEAKEAVWAR